MSTPKIWAKNMSNLPPRKSAYTKNQSPGYWLKPCMTQTRSPTSPLIFTGDENCKILASIFDPSSV